MLFYFNFDCGEISPLLSSDGGSGIYHYCAVLNDAFEAKEIHCAFAKSNIKNYGYEWFELEREEERNQWENWKWLLPKLNSAILMHAPTEYVTVGLKPTSRFDYYDFWKCWTKN